MMYSNNCAVAGNSMPSSCSTPACDMRVYDTMPYTSTAISPANMTNMGIQGIPGDDGERFFFAPFVLGGLAGTALGYGIANNNRPPYPVYYPPMMMQQPYPMYTTNYYY